MKFVIHGGEHQERHVYLLLVENDSGSVTLEVVNEFGNSVRAGSILTITEDGKLLLYDNLNTTMGVEVEKNGRIVLDEKDEH